ncbi:hypothetical protein ON010_g18707 [Phytophthora cinnamomi]|nr:hypothetical protein ON010_g18707 [Phytophthora cinnamomi]
MDNDEAPRRVGAQVHPAHETEHPHVCRITPRRGGDTRAASGAVYDRLNDLVLYFTRIEKAERQLAIRDKSKSFKDPRKDYRKEKDQGREEPLKNRYKRYKKKTGQASSSRGVQRRRDELRRGRELFQALLDSGASKTFINKTTLDANDQLGRKLIPASPTLFDTMSGKVNGNGTTVAQFLSPQFKADTIDTHGFKVIQDSSDAMIIGRDITNELGLILNFKDRVVRWEDYFLSLNTGRNTTKPDTDKQDDLEFLEEAKEAAGNAVEPEELLPEHLQGKLTANYLALLTAYQTLYYGHLERMQFEDYELALSPDFKPVHANPYLIARSQEQKSRTRFNSALTTTYWSKFTTRRWHPRRFSWSSQTVVCAYSSTFDGGTRICGGARTTCPESGRS